MQEKPAKRHFRFLIIEFLIIGGIICLFLNDVPAQQGRMIREDALPRPDTQAQLKKSAAHLFFAGRDNYFLMSELRIVPHSESPVDYARAIVTALIKGPQGKLVRTIATGTELRALYISPSGVSYIDLSQAAAKGHPGGCTSEFLTIYSIVNSLILNIPEIKRVKILVEGKEVPTLAGHIDLKQPLEANMLLIR